MRSDAHSTDRAVGPRVRRPGSSLLACLGAAAMALGGCGGSSGPGIDAAGIDAGSASDASLDAHAPTCAEQRAAIEAEMSAALDVAATDTAITTDPDFTVLLRASDGATYTHAHGSSSPSTSYASASTSKLVAAVVIMSLVD